jgi:hypothetical protein
MNSRKIAYVLNINGFENYIDFIPTNFENDFLFVENVKTKEYFKIHIEATEPVEKVEKIDAFVKEKIVKEEKYIPKEEPMYKDLEPFNVMSNITKNKDIENEDSDLNIMEDFDYEFEPVETVNEIINENNEISDAKDLEINIEQERIQKEFDELKKQQENDLKKNIKKKSGPKKKKAPPSGKPQGWHLKAEFVGKDGTVYHRGIEQPQLKGTIDPTV